MTANTTLDTPQSWQGMLRFLEPFIGRVQNSLRVSGRLTRSGEPRFENSANRETRFGDYALVDAWRGSLGRSSIPGTCHDEECPGFRRFDSVASQTSAFPARFGLSCDRPPLRLKFTGEPAICGRIGFAVDGFG